MSYKRNIILFLKGKVKDHDSAYKKPPLRGAAFKILFHVIPSDLSSEALAKEEVEGSGALK